QAAEISGVQAQVIRNIVAAGVVRPTQHGRSGPGGGHRFGLSEVFALTLGKVYKDNGAAADRAMGGVRLVSGTSIERLEAQFDKGEFFPVPAMLMGDDPRPACWMDGMFIKPPAMRTPGARSLLAAIDPRPVLKRVKRDANQLDMQSSSRSEREPAAR